MPERREETQRPGQSPAVADAAPSLGTESLTLVAAPAGFGKSRLLSVWFDRLRGAGRFPVRLSLAPTERSNDAINARVVAAMKSVPTDDRILFVDDIGHVSAEVIERLVLDFFDRGLGSQLVLAGRTTMHAPLRPGLGLTVGYVGAADLRLDADAVEGTLRAHVPDLDSAEVAPLLAALEGWAAGAHIAGNALADAADRTSFVSGFDGSDRDIADYFESEIVSGLPQTTQEFLMRIAVLREPTAILCDEVTGSEGSDAMLASLGTSSALIIAEPGGRYRWMPLARSFLLDRLDRRGPSASDEQRTRAGAAFERRGQFGNLLDHAVEMSDWQLAIDVLLDHGLDLIAAGEGRSVGSVLNELPPSSFDREAGLALIAAVSIAGSGDGDHQTIEDWLAHAATVEGGRLPGGVSSVAAAAAVIRALFGGLDPQAGYEQARRALVLEGPRRTVWAVLASAAAGAHAFFDDQTEVARMSLADCMELQSDLVREERGHISSAIWSSAVGLSAILALDNGDYQLAMALVSAAEINARKPGNSDVTASLNLARGRAAQHRGDDAEALVLYRAVAHDSVFPRLRALAHLEAAAIHAATPDPEARDEELSAAEAVLAEIGAPGRLLDRRRTAIETQLGSTAGDPPLTEREGEVLRLLESDRSRREIAAELYLSHNTVKTYVRRLYQKLGVSSRPAAVAKARERGWL